MLLFSIVLVLYFLRTVSSGKPYMSTSTYELMREGKMNWPEMIWGENFVKNGQSPTRGGSFFIHPLFSRKVRFGAENPHKSLFSSKPVAQSQVSMRLHGEKTRIAFQSTGRICSLIFFTPLLIHNEPSHHLHPRTWFTLRSELTPQDWKFIEN